MHRREHYSVGPSSAFLGQLSASALSLLFRFYSKWRATLVRRASRTRLVLVRARTLQSRHRNSEQAEIHPQLRAMMNEMVHHNAADDGHARHREDLLTTGKEFPRFQHLLVANRRERGARFRRLLVERRQKILAIFRFRRLVRRLPTHRRIVELFPIDGHGRPAGKQSDMARKPADSS